MEQERVLVYDRIGRNQRNTLLLLALFVLVLSALSIVIGLVVGLPYPYAPLLIIPFLLFALFSYYSSSNIVLGISRAGGGEGGGGGRRTPPERPWPGAPAAPGRRLPEGGPPRQPPPPPPATRSTR